MKTIITAFSNPTSEGVTLHLNQKSTLKTGNIKASEFWVSWDKIGEHLFEDYADKNSSVNDSNELRQTETTQSPNTIESVEGNESELYNFLGDALEKIDIDSDDPNPYYTEKMVIEVLKLYRQSQSSSLTKLREALEHILEKDYLSVAGIEYVENVLENKESQWIEIKSEADLPKHQVPCWFAIKGDEQVGYYVPHKQSFAGVDEDYHYTQVRKYSVLSALK